MAEDTLNALDVPGEVAPVTELEPPVATAPETPIDEPPSAETLEADIEQLKKDKIEANEKAEAAKNREAYWKRQREGQRKAFEQGAPPAQPTPAAAETNEKPKQDDFDDYNDYTEALTDWKVDQKKVEWDKEEKAKTENATYQEKMIKLEKGIDEGFDKYPDFAEVALAKTVPITPLIKDILAETDNPADVAYYLGKNQSEAIRIGRLTPIAAAREIAKIEAEITVAPTAPAGTPKKITDAPPPIKPVGSANVIGKDPENMTQKEYEKWREDNGAKRF